MLRLLLGIPAFLVAFVWSLFFPARAVAAPVPQAPLPDPNAPSTESLEDGHELSDASPKLVGIFVLGLFAVIFGSMAALGWMYTHLYTNTQAIPVHRQEESFKHAPRAQTSIAKDWEAIDAQAHARLDHYGWTDRARGAVHIPIDQAMELVAKEGLPARNGQTPSFPPPDQEKLPLMQLESTADATKFDPH